MKRWVIKDSDGNCDEPENFAAYCSCGHLLMESREVMQPDPAEGKTLRGTIVLDPEVRFEYAVKRRNIPDTFYNLNSYPDSMPG